MVIAMLIRTEAGRVASLIRLGAKAGVSKSRSEARPQVSA
jgi:hypothetical protein